MFKVVQKLNQRTAVIGSAFNPINTCSQNHGESILMQDLQSAKQNAKCSECGLAACWDATETVYLKQLHKSKYNILCTF